MSKTPYPNEFVHHVANKCVLGSSFTDDMINVAVNLMELGYNHPGLLDIAIERPGQQPDWPVQPRLEAVLRDLDMWPTRTEAITATARGIWQPMLDRGAPLEEFEPAMWGFYEFRELRQLEELVYSLDDLEWVSKADREWLFGQIRAFCRDEPPRKPVWPPADLQPPDDRSPARLGPEATLAERLKAWFLRHW